MNIHLSLLAVGAPELHQWKYPLPGDSAIIRIHRVIIHVNRDRGIVRLKMASDARKVPCATISPVAADWMMCRGVRTANGFFCFYHP